MVQSLLASTPPLYVFRPGPAAASQNFFPNPMGLVSLWFNAGQPSFQAFCIFPTRHMIFVV
jgi:hypothetical protein